MPAAKPARKRAPASPRRPRSRFSADAMIEGMWESPLVGVAVLDAELRYLRVNPALAALNGKPARAHVGRRVLDVVPTLPRVVVEDLEAAIATRRPRLGREIQAEVAGERRHWSVSTYPLRGGRSRAPGAVVILRETTERVRAEEERQSAAAELEELLRELRSTLRERDESMAMLDALFATAPVGLALLDREMRVVRVNPAFAAIAGLPPERMLGRTPWEIAPGLPHDEMLRDFRLVLESGVPVTDREVRGDTPAAPGRSRCWLETLYPVRVGGKTIGIGLLLREVTAQRVAEDFQRELLPIVGHDLRSPLLAITSSASMLRHGRLSERDDRAVGRILSSAARMDGIVRALADYTELQVGRGIPLERAPADLGAICRQVADEVEAAFPGRIVRVERDSDAHGAWDGDRVGQVLANLVTNAVSYSPDGTPVEVRCRGAGADVVVEVRNAGPPIPPEFLPHVWDPFRRGPAAQEGRARKGLGLGLFIARAIVLAHGGGIEARSTAAEGTVFAVRLPRAPPAHAPA